MSATTKSITPPPDLPYPHRALRSSAFQPPMAGGQEVVDQMRSWDRLRLSATIAVECRPDARERK
jgi:hypothetical protein